MSVPPRTRHVEGAHPHALWEVCTTGCAVSLPAGRSGQRAGTVSQRRARTIAASGELGDHLSMATQDPYDGPPSAQPGAATNAEPPDDETQKKHRNPWIWISGALAIIAIGLLVWALNTKSDLDSTQQDVDNLESQVEQGKQTGSSFVAAAKTAFQDLTQQLGATSEDLADAEQNVNDAQQTADQAQKDADAAKQAADKANDATEKAKAEADQAKAETKAAESKATITADCAKAYVAALGTLFEGDDVRAQATQVREQLKGITSQCQTALGGA
jgi:uncharacterized membrane-anchored protein YhcB (DUF1043 family)